MRHRQPVDEGRGDVAVHVQGARGKPLLLERRVDLLLRLRLHEVVAVGVGHGVVAASAGHAAVGVGGRDDDQDGVVEQLVHGVVLAARHRGEVTDDLHHGVGALVLGAVDVGLDVDGHLDVVAVRVEQRLGCGRVGELDRADVLPARVVAPLVRGLEGVDHDDVHVAAASRLARDHVVHAMRHAEARRLSLDQAEGRPDGRVGDQCQGRTLLARHGLGGIRTTGPVESERRGREEWRDGVAVPRRGERCREGGGCNDEQQRD